MSHYGCLAWLQAFLPESPRWLLLARKEDRAKAALRWARGKAGRDAASLTAEFDDIVNMSADLNEVRGGAHLLIDLDLSADPPKRLENMENACIVSVSVFFSASDS